MQWKQWWLMTRVQQCGTVRLHDVALTCRHTELTLYEIWWKQNTIVIHSGELIWHMNKWISEWMNECPKRYKICINQLTAPSIDNTLWKDENENNKNFFRYIWIRCTLFCVAMSYLSQCEPHFSLCRLHLVSRSNSNNECFSCVQYSQTEDTLHSSFSLCCQLTRM